MPAWALAEHGDGVERAFGALVAIRFPLYETFWAQHVVPLTYRVVDPSHILVRSAVRKELETLATTHYGVFVHLAGCHQQLQTDPNLFAAGGVYGFYSRLYSVGECVERFLAAVRTVVAVYDGKTFGGRQTEQRLEINGAPGLSKRFEEAFEKRTKDYRGQQVHAWGFPVLEGRLIPRRQYLPGWYGKGLGGLDTFLKGADPEARVATEFVDANEQASEDLEFVERVLNEVWKMALGELAGIKRVDDYKKDQAIGTGDTLPSKLAAPLCQRG